jgi:hypothetical protein
MYLTKPKTPPIPRLPLMMDKPPITRGGPSGTDSQVRWLRVHLFEKHAFLLNHVPHINSHNEHIASVCVWDDLKIDQAVIETQRVKNREGRALHTWKGLPKGSMRCVPLLELDQALQFKPVDCPMPQLPWLILSSSSRGQYHKIYPHILDCSCSVYSLHFTSEGRGGVDTLPRFLPSLIHNLTQHQAKHR